MGRVRLEVDLGWEWGVWLQQLEAENCPLPLAHVFPFLGQQKEDLKDLDLRGKEEKRIRTQIYIWPDNMSNSKLCPLKHGG